MDNQGQALASSCELSPIVCSKREKCNGSYKGVNCWQLPKKICFDDVCGKKVIISRFLLFGSIGAYTPINQEFNANRPLKLISWPINPIHMERTGDCQSLPNILKNWGLYVLIIYYNNGINLMFAPSRYRGSCHFVQV